MPLSLRVTCPADVQRSRSKPLEENGLQLNGQRKSERGSLDLRIKIGTSSSKKKTQGLFKKARQVGSQYQRQSYLPNTPRKNHLSPMGLRKSTRAQGEKEDYVLSSRPSGLVITPKTVQEKVLVKKEEAIKGKHLDRMSSLSRIIFFGSGTERSVEQIKELSQQMSQEEREAMLELVGSFESAQRNDWLAELQK